MSCQELAKNSAVSYSRFFFTFSQLQHSSTSLFLFLLLFASPMPSSSPVLLAHSISMIYTHVDQQE